MASTVKEQVDGGGPPQTRPRFRHVPSPPPRLQAAASSERDQLFPVYPLRQVPRRWPGRPDWPLVEKNCRGLAAGKPLIATSEAVRDCGAQARDCPAGRAEGQTPAGQAPGEKVRLQARDCPAGPAEGQISSPGAGGP